MKEKHKKEMKEDEDPDRVRNEEMKKRRGEMMRKFLFLPKCKGHSLVQGWSGESSH